jgi:hypothetical protein
MVQLPVISLVRCSPSHFPIYHRGGTCRFLSSLPVIRRVSESTNLVQLFQDDHGPSEQVVPHQRLGCGDSA